MPVPHDLLACFPFLNQFQIKRDWCPGDIRLKAWAYNRHQRLRVDVDHSVGRASVHVFVTVEAGRPERPCVTCCNFRHV